MPTKYILNRQSGIRERASQSVPGFDEIFLRIVRHEVGTVVHYLHPALVAVLAYHVYHRFLGHPDEVCMLVELHYQLYDSLHGRLGEHACKVVPVLGMEGGHERDLPLAGYAHRGNAGSERAVRVDYLELDLGDTGNERGVYLGYSGDIRMPERHGHGEIVQHLIGQGGIVRTRHVGCYDIGSPVSCLRPVCIVLHTYRHPVHHRREAVAEQSNVCGTRRGGKQGLEIHGTVSEAKPHYAEIHDSHNVQHRCGDKGEGQHRYQPLPP